MRQFVVWLIASYFKKILVLWHKRTHSTQKRVIRFRNVQYKIVLAAGNERVFFIFFTNLLDFVVVDWSYFCLWLRKNKILFTCNYYRLHPQSRLIPLDRLVIVWSGATAWAKIVIDGWASSTSRWWVRRSWAGTSVASAEPKTKMLLIYRWKTS